jgi:superfamily II DNA/RNA helicase
VPTGWRLPEEALVGTPGDQHRKMLDAMAVDQDRDRLVVDVVQDELRRDEQILIFSLRVDHCRRLVGELADAGVAAGLMLGGLENRQQLKEAVDGMRAGRMRVAVGTVQAVGTGVDLPRVGVGVATMPIASNRQNFGQVAGRLCRIAGGSGPARLYCLADPCRARDWGAYFADSRPVLVRRPDGNWLDARQDKRQAKGLAFPPELGGILSSGVEWSFPGDDQWRLK